MCMTVHERVLLICFMHAIVRPGSYSFKKKGAIHTTGFQNSRLHESDINISCAILQAKERLISILLLCSYRTFMLKI